MSARAGIIVTGTEVLTGRVSDLNGPWLAEQLRQAGVDVGFTVVVGDRPQDLVDALDFLAGARVDLVVTSGGLGPTADDLTAAVVGDWQGRPSTPDPALEARITAIVERLSARRGWTVDPEAMAAGTAKQALVPDGRRGARAHRYGARARRTARGRGPRPPARRRAPRAAERAAGHVAGRGRLAAGERRTRPAGPSCGSRRSGCGGRRRRRSRPRCAASTTTWTAWRSPPACAVGSSRW